MAAIGTAPCRQIHPRDDGADPQPEKRIQRPHLLRVPTGQVVVDRHHMHGNAGNAGNAGRQRCRERLALPSLHLRELAREQRPGPHQLHVERPHAEAAPTGLPDQGEGPAACLRMIERTTRHPQQFAADCFVGQPLDGVRLAARGLGHRLQPRPERSRAMPDPARDAAGPAIEGVLRALEPFRIDACRALDPSEIFRH
jgi:hypothetical protein